MKTVVSDLKKILFLVGVSVGCLFCAAVAAIAWELHLRAQQVWPYTFPGSVWICQEPYMQCRRCRYE